MFVPLALSPIKPPRGWKWATAAAANSSQRSSPSGPAGGPAGGPAAPCIGPVDLSNGPDGRCALRLARLGPPPSPDLATRAHLHKPPLSFLFKDTHTSCPQQHGRTRPPDSLNPPPRCCLVRCKASRESACHGDSCWISSFKYVIQTPEDSLRVLVSARCSLPQPETRWKSSPLHAFVNSH